jgi:hypothetical protein
VGPTLGALDPPEVVVGGPGEASGPRSHRGWSCRGLPLAVGFAAGQPLASPGRDDARGLREKLPDGLRRPPHR